MAITRVQSAAMAIAPNQSSAEVSLPSAPAAGNLLVGVGHVTEENAAALTFTPPTTDSVLWSTAVDVRETTATHTAHLIICYRADCGTANSFTLGVSAAVDICWSVYEYSGAATSSPLHDTVSAVGNSTTADTELLATHAGELRICGIGNQNNNAQDPWTYTGAFSLLEHEATPNSTGAHRTRLSTHEWIGAADGNARVVANPFSADRSWVAAIAAFKEPSAAAAAPPAARRRRFAHLLVR